MVQIVDDGGKVLAHVGRRKPRTALDFRLYIIEVGDDDLVNPSLLIRIVESIRAVGKESECTADENTFRVKLLELARSIEHTAAGGDHVVDDDDVPSLDVASKKFMCDDGVLSVYDL